MGRRPNVLITGTPGTGKTTMCEQLAGATGLTHVEVGKLVRCGRLVWETAACGPGAPLPSCAPAKHPRRASRTLCAAQRPVVAGLREKELHTGWDDEFDCHILDEDKVRPLPPAASAPPGTLGTRVRHNALSACPCP